MFVRFSDGRLVTNSYVNTKYRQAPPDPSPSVLYNAPPCPKCPLLEAFKKRCFRLIAWDLGVRLKPSHLLDTTLGTLVEHHTRSPHGTHSQYIV